MSKRFSYSILTYKHSQFLGEVLNVGVLFIFPDENTIEFHYPKSLVRLSGAYSDFNTHLIKDYLRSFEQKAQTLNPDFDQYVFGNNAIITDNFIIEDASVLQFDPFRSAIYYGTLDEVRDRYKNLLLGHYNSETIKTSSKIDDKEIVDQVKEKVFQLNPRLRNYLKFDSHRILRSQHVAFKSDFYWRNSGVNYAKAVSFDLAKESRIIDKALLINGKLRQLEKSEHRNVHIDLIVHSPIDSRFNDAILEAKSILRDNQFPSELHNDIEQYSHEIANHIRTN